MLVTFSFWFDSGVSCMQASEAAVVGFSNPLLLRGIEKRGELIAASEGAIKVLKNTLMQKAIFEGDCKNPRAFSELLGSLADASSNGIRFLRGENVALNVASLRTYVDVFQTSTDEGTLSHLKERTLCYYVLCCAALAIDEKLARKDTPIMESVIKELRAKDTGVVDLWLLQKRLSEASMWSSDIACCFSMLNAYQILLFALLPEVIEELEKAAAASADKAVGKRVLFTSPLGRSPARPVFSVSLGGAYDISKSPERKHVLEHLLSAREFLPHFYSRGEADRRKALVLCGQCPDLNGMFALMEMCKTYLEKRTGRETPLQIRKMLTGGDGNETSFRAAMHVYLNSLNSTFVKDEFLSFRNAFNLFIVGVFSCCWPAPGKEQVLSAWKKTLATITAEGFKVLIDKQEFLGTFGFPESIQSLLVSKSGGLLSEQHAAKIALMAHVLIDLQGFYLCAFKAVLRDAAVVGLSDK